eukprot:m.55031 g.55031  ORF g.55031 m.55031 type:complete len:59 (+) comp7576_c0_seq1:467-643(+)
MHQSYGLRRVSASRQATPKTLHPFGPFSFVRAGSVGSIVPTITIVIAVPIPILTVATR